ncbi:MAG: tryptophan synthase subunit alpha [Candidatus Roizmanbacteria bacterium]
MKTNKIDTQLEFIKKNKKIGIMTHVILGYPNIQSSKDIIDIMVQGGSDFIEMQIPFSDPIADGSTIMQASDISLRNGTRVRDAFIVAQEVTQKYSIPFLFMGYFNTVLNYGIEKFCNDASIAGISGVIIPDIPPDEESYEHFYSICEKYNLYVIRLLSPSSTEERIKLNAISAKGFMYCISRHGVTGSQNNLDNSLEDYIGRVKKHISIPIAVGFGISKREHIQELIGKVDIAVIGSALINIYNKNKSLIELKTFLEEITT